MKKAILLCVFAVAGFALHAQVHSLNENFNTSCVTSPGTIFTSFNWSEYTIPLGISALSWGCAPLDGRDGTQGIACSNFYSSTYYFDTSWLFTPEMDLSQYPGSVYLQFDTKYTQVAAKLSLRLYTYDSVGHNPDSTASTFVNLTPSVTSIDTSHLAGEPYIGDPDSSQWVTRQIDLTLYKTANMYIAFLYTSTASSEGTWALDNILTTGTSLNVWNINNSAIPLTVLGNSTSSQIRLAYTIRQSGMYDLAVYDIMGRTVYKANITARSGTNTYTINGLNLSNGMYLIKMGNGNAYGIAKTVIQE